MSAHRLNRDLAFSPEHVRRDPGASGVLKADMSLVTYAIDTDAAESRVLETPKRAGIRLTISLIDDGGDLTVTTQGDETMNDGTTAGISATLDDAGDVLDLVSYEYSQGVFYWLVTGNIGCTLNAA